MLRLLVIAVLAALAAQSQSPQPEVPRAPVASQTQPQLIYPCTAIRTGEAEAAPVASYVDESIPVLKKQVPTLRSIRVDAAPDPTASILDHTGEVLADLLHRIPNLIAKEEVRRTLDPGPPSSIPLGRRGGELEATQNDSTVTRYKSRDYVYRIEPGRGLAGTEILKEFRADAHGHPIDDSGLDPDSPRNIGFATSWLFFLPINRPESSFRYLGQQKIGKHDTFVVAFAQNPGHDRLNTVVDFGQGQCSTPRQGVAWVDQSSYRILRMQTDLISPLPAIPLTLLRSELDYIEVRIPERDLVLWLPATVKNSWQAPGISGDELHIYSHYRLFGSTIRIVPDTEIPPP